MGISGPSLLGGLTVEADRGNAGYVYFIKVDIGLLISTKSLNTSVSMQSLNQHNYLKGSGIRCGSSAEILKYFNSDLGGAIIPYGVEQNGIGYRQVFQIPWTNGGMVLQDYYKFPYAETSGFTKSKISFTDSSMGFLPFYEYVDNSKSTNIFY